MTEEELRAAYQVGRAMESDGRGSCPDPEQLRALVEREGDEAGRLRLLEHVATCATCHEEVALIRMVAGNPPARRRGRGYLAIAASFVLIAGVAAGAWALNRTGEPAAFRAEQASPLTLLIPRPDAPGPTGLFVWRPVEGAVEYHLEVFDATGRAIFAATTQDTAVALAEGTDLEGAVLLNWWVRARLDDGSEVVSDTWTFGGPGA